jgi:hypothetical protein
VNSCPFILTAQDLIDIFERIDGGLRDDARAARLNVLVTRSWEPGVRTVIDVRPAEMPAKEDVVMRLSTNNKLSKSLKKAADRRSRVAARAFASSQNTLFEPMEDRQMFSMVIPGPIIPHPIIPVILTNSAITAEYAATASETDAYGTNVHSLLGSATSQIEYVSGVSGAEVQFFHDNGAIYWSSGTGAHVVYGSIGAEYQHLASETDAYGKNVQLIVGLPTSDEKNLAGAAGARTNTFQSGQIDWSYPTGAHVVYGQIGGLYNSMGGASSWLGLPTSDEAGPQTNRVSGYQNGYISWSPSGGPVAHNNSISVTTRYGGELVVTAAGTRDSINVSESGTTLTIIADGQVFVKPAPAEGLFVYTRGGSDTVYIGTSVATRTTVDSIDAAPTTVYGWGGNNYVWADSTDTVIGWASTHKVASFAGGVSKALASSLPNPSDSGTTFTVHASLFGKNPIAADINQGAVGDCYYLASLASFANQKRTVILNSAVDLGDGTYAVEFYNSGTPEFVRVNNSFPVGGFNGYEFAQPGSNGSIWGPVMEKAFAYFRKGANTYSSIGYGSPSEAYSDLNQSSSWVNFTAMSDNTLYNTLSNDLASSKAVVLCTPSAPPQLVGDHCYSLIGTQTVGGVHEYIVRNPWGTSGDSLENSHGIAYLTYAEVEANFGWILQAT